VLEAATAVLKPALVGADVAIQAGTVVAGIVRGGLHDIGKNLVCMMLEAAGFALNAAAAMTVAQGLDKG